MEIKIRFNNRVFRAKNSNFRIIFQEIQDRRDNEPLIQRDRIFQSREDP